VAELSPSVADEEVLRQANGRNALLLTADKDFGELVFRQRLVHSGVILLRLAGLANATKAELVADVCRERARDPKRSASSRQGKSAFVEGPERRMPARFSESVVEEAALAWLENLGYAVLSGPAIAAGEPGAERSDLAPPDTLSACEQPASPVFRRVLANTEQSRIFALLRDSLLPKLISGELRIRDAERVAVGVS